MIDLNIELSKCDDWASSTLPERERRYLFGGLPNLMERLLISKARHIRALNAFGIKKMNRNMLALQQNIKSITQNNSDAEFDRAKRYYALFSMSPQVRYPVCESERDADYHCLGHARQHPQEAGVQLRRVQDDAGPPVRR